MTIEFLSLLIAIATASTTVTWKISQMELSLQLKLNHLHELIAARLAEIERDIMLNKQQGAADLEAVNQKIENLERLFQQRIADLRQRIQEMEGQINVSH